MMKHLYPALLTAVLLLAGLSVNAQTTASAVPPPQAAPAQTPVKVNNTTWFPFTVDEAALTARVHVKDARVSQYYTPLFRKYFYAGNARTWEGMIEELMAVKDMEFSLHNKLELDTDGDYFLLKASSRAELDYFLKLVQPTFAVISRLEEFIKKVDPKHISDGSHLAED